MMKWINNLLQSPPPHSLLRYENQVQKHCNYMTIYYFELSDYCEYYNVFYQQY